MTKGPGPKPWASVAGRKTSLRALKRALKAKARKDPALAKKLREVENGNR